MGTYNAPNFQKRSQDSMKLHPAFHQRYKYRPLNGRNMSILGNCYLAAPFTGLGSPKNHTQPIFLPSFLDPSLNSKQGEDGQASICGWIRQNNVPRIGKKKGPLFGGRASRTEKVLKSCQCCIVYVVCMMFYLWRKICHFPKGCACIHKGKPYRGWWVILMVGRR